MCVSQDGFSVLVITCPLAAGIGRRAHKGAILAREPKSGGRGFYRTDGFPIVLDGLKNSANRPRRGVRWDG